MERENYLESLRSMTADKRSISERYSPSTVVRNGNRTTVSTQTNNGVWLDTKKPKNSRKRQSNDSIEDIKNIKGTIHVDGNNLISDGCGGYYMRVHLQDIRPIHGKSNKHSIHHNYVPRSSNIGQDPSGSYQSPPNQPNHRPNPSGRFFPDQQNPSGRYYSDQPTSNGLFYPDQPNPSGRFYPDQSRYRMDRRNTDHNSRTFGPSFHHQKLVKAANDDLFK